MDEQFIAEVRDLVANPAQAPRLHRIVFDETDRVIQGMGAESLSPGAPLSDEEFTRRLGACEELTESLARACGLLAYWSGTTDTRLLPRVVARLANALERNAGQQPYLELMLYPSVLALYAAGLGAVVGRREWLLADLLGLATIRVRNTWQSTAETLYAAAAIDHRIGQRLPGLERHRTSERSGLRGDPSLAG